LSGASGSAGFVGGRMSVPVPPAEVRYIPIPAPAPLVPPVETAPAEPAAIVPPGEPAPVAPIEPPVVTAAPADAKPLQPSRPKVEAKPAPPKPQKAIAKKPRADVSRQRRPTADECTQMRGAGRTVVKAGGRLRGYSDDQIERALRDCAL
jgi:hypothetical protein